MSGQERRSGIRGRALACLVAMAALGVAAACDASLDTAPPAGFRTPPAVTEAPWSGGPGDSGEPWATPSDEPGVTPVEEPTPTHTAAPKLVALPKLTIKVSGATVIYFSVSGSTSAALLSSIGVHSVKPCGVIEYTWYSGDNRPAACAQYAYWYRETSTSSACWVSSVWVVSTVYFPRWASPSRVSAPLLAWWRKWIAVVQKHEAGHVAVARKWLPTVRSRLVGISCSRVKTTLARVMKQVEAAQEAYDKAQYSVQVFPDPPDG